MQIRIVAVGQRITEWAQSAVSDYLSRFPRDFRVELREIRTEPRAGQTPARLMAAEAERILAAIEPDDFVVVLDEHGKDLTTMDLARHFALARRRRNARLRDRRPRRPRPRGEGQGQPDDPAFVDDPAARLCARHALRADLPRMVDPRRPSLPSSLTPMSSKTIFLASKSPRRRDLLTRLGYDVRVIASNAHTLMAFEGDEVVLPDEAPKAYVLRTARNKFLEGLGVKNAGEFAGVRLPIVAADTVVSLGNEILGKPRDFDEACLFLEKLSGRTHDVRTAVYVGLSETACDWRISHSTVSFRELTHAEIEAYANSGEPYDKAGGYGIQGLASIFISNISGSYTGIMGLPVYETAELLANAGLPVFNAQ